MILLQDEAFVEFVSSVLPVKDDIDRIEEDIVYLDLDKHSIETLPAVPMS